MTIDEARTKFEHEVYAQFFIKSVKIASDRIIWDAPQTTKQELLKLDSSKDYARKDISAMWYGYQLALGLIK